MSRDSWALTIISPAVVFFRFRSNESFSHYFGFGTRHCRSESSLGLNQPFQFFAFGLCGHTFLATIYFVVQFTTVNWKSVTPASSMVITGYGDYFFWSACQIVHVCNQDPHTAHRCSTEMGQGAVGLCWSMGMTVR